MDTLFCNGGTECSHPKRMFVEYKNHCLFESMSDSEDDGVEKQLKIVIVGEAGSGKVKNLGPSGIFRKAACFMLAFN